MLRPRERYLRSIFFTLVTDILDLSIRYTISRSLDVLYQRTHFLDPFFSSEVTPYFPEPRTTSINGATPLFELLI